AVSRVPALVAQAEASTAKLAARNLIGRMGSPVVMVKTITLRIVRRAAEARPSAPDQLLDQAEPEWRALGCCDHGDEPAGEDQQRRIGPEGRPELTLESASFDERFHAAAVLDTRRRLLACPLFLNESPRRSV